CTSLPLYPDTLLLKTHVHTRPIGQRPFVELEPTDHPLSVERADRLDREGRHHPSRQRVCLPRARPHAPQRRSLR
ncbi:MAG: DUF2199 domain-containing protein, partial [Thermoplasmata archaeon]|nr:DUF2199 domain-containing protein [Thermoplasmata archaeon]